MYTLITSATSVKAHQLKSKINAPNVLLGDHLELPAFMLKGNQMISLPDPGSPTYTHEMLTLCLDKEIDTICPLKPEEAALLMTAKQLFNEYGIEVIIVAEDN